MLSSTLFLFTLIPPSLGVRYCPLLGPNFPKPRNLTTNEVSRSAAELLSSSVEQALHVGGSAFANDTLDATSFSTSIFSVHESTPIFEYHHTARLLDVAAGGTTNVTADTVFRIGSVSKLLTVYALLLQGGRIRFDDRISAYIPELMTTDELDEVQNVQWDEVTIEALASHMAGIGRDFNLADLATQSFPWTQHGLPALVASEVPACAGNEEQQPCSKEAFFKGFTARHPVFAPFSTPIYSNAAFRILGYVLENITKQPYEMVLQSAILKPLNMSRTSVSKPSNDSWGIIPEGDNGWAMELGDEGPAGGMYSTTRDLSNLARSIIQNSRLTSAQTRRWLKPVAHTASLELSVGATWEIRRAKLNPLNHRVVDLYTKTGSVGSYGSLIVLIPNYDVAFTILTAGYNNSLVDILAEMLMETFLPVLEQVSKEQAANAFAGIYASTTAINSSLSLITDDGPGLAIDAWISNGTDVLDTFKSLADATGGGRPVGRVRVYPTELTSPASNAEPTDKHAFRAVFQVADKSESDANHRREIFSEDCSTWSSVDEPMYGNNAVDDFIFHTDLHENVVSVELRAFRASLVKKLGQGVEHKEGVNEASMAVL